MATDEHDFYAVLGVSRNASDDELRRAYKVQALKYHPGKFRPRAECLQGLLHSLQDDSLHHLSAQAAWVWFDVAQQPLITSRCGGLQASR